MTTEPQILTDAELRGIQGQYLNTIGSRDARIASCIKAGRAIEQAVLQSPEIQALRKDADRYRHLRDEAELCPHDIFNAWWLSDHGNPQTLDAAIDAAMEQKP